MTSTDDLPQHPTPGSPAAHELGCRCPAKRNNDGQQPPFAAGTHLGGPDGGWYIAAECPTHATTAYRGAVIGVNPAIARARWH